MDSRIVEFVDALNKKFSDPAQNGGKHVSRFYIDKGGRKFVRIYKKSWIPDSGMKYNNEEHAQRMAYCFVDTMTMDILKPAGWKAPTAGARASIATTEAITEAVTQSDPFGSWLYR